MASLVYSANVSLDGYMEDAQGSLDWSVPDDAVHAFWNEHERTIGTSLYGRRMYEAMRIWETDEWIEDQPGVAREYAGIWRSSEKIVYSTTLEEATTARTRIEQRFDPETVRQLKTASPVNLSIGGATLGAEAFRHGLVDEIVLVVCPVLLGGGKPALPDGVHLELELLEQQRFPSGAVALRYAVGR